MSGHLSAELLLEGYRQGIFPMSENKYDPELFWVNPKERGIFPINGFHLSRSLRRRLLKVDYEVKVSTAFAEVVRACADRKDSWINQTIFELYCTLAAKGKAHSIEIWQNRALIGGVYGVVDGAAFFGESMFSRERDASKMALAYLMHRLDHTGFKLFDTQFLTEHLASLGAIEISRQQYSYLLTEALSRPANFLNPGYSVTASDVVHRSGQIS
ncbi:MAG: leucyl/phenylalanyl-tRNA--protein transferase [Paracoccaceae bacterium]|nr:leucyl/phenylalanyl-tRNA--protein transferase [Paracoccaceae bacterium]